MYYRIVFSFILFTVSLFGKAQNLPGDLKTDTITVQQLSEVIIKSYGQNRRLLEVPAAINYIGSAQLNRFNNTSLLPAINNTPGVRMEERSPGSYRINFRGSSLRSPFGVRNVKVYFDDIPFTDPGGNTYLNQLSFFNVHSLEIIKGPAGSLYGSGTGGALLINSQPLSWQQGADVQYLHGSFDLNSYNAQLRLGKEERRNIFNYSHQTSNGYRQHTQMRRDIATWQTQIKAGEKQQLNATVLYGDLYYQTPGALTEAEYNQNGKAARPKSGIFPSADGSKAAIYQKTFLAGVTNEYSFSDQWQNTTAVYGAFSQIKNPTFRNYERRMEPHFGARTVFKFGRQINSSFLQWLFGSEGQKGFFNTKTFRNLNGNPDALLTDDDINNWTYSVFTQATLSLPHDWNITAGVSINKSSVEITRLSVPSSVPNKKTSSSEWAPRLAVSKTIFKGVALYGSIAKGFSPPTVQELLPSTSIINTELEAEHGISYEAGVKGSWNKLYVEVNAFDFQLKNAIVQRRDSSGADYFTNAGSTKQRGLESQVHYQFAKNNNRFLANGKIWVTHTYNHFRYKDFKQLANDYSGKQLPGAAPHTATAGLDVVTKPGLYARFTYFYSDPIALNDGNTAYASSYNLLGGRIGWQKAIKKIRVDLFIGADNIFNAKYSLGNDINAAGGRYYNTAPGVNYFGGIQLKY